MPLIVGSILTAVALAVTGARAVWFVAAGICTAAIVGYVLSRTTGLPMDHDDVGNWLEPLGLAALFVEGSVLLLAAAATAAARVGAPPTGGPGYLPIGSRDRATSQAR